MVAPGDMGGDLSGRLLGGRYRVTGQLGRGGMGVVCRAVDELLGREVAVKVLRAYTDASGAELADLRTRMQREARAAARIRHSGVITVHDVADEDGLPVIVMELIDGPSLDDAIDERGVVDPLEAARIGAKVADALAAGHDAGVLHRDVKPGNVLLDSGGRVVLTDFGIASMEAPDDGATTKLTRSGELIGSLDYLAPERAQGQDPGPASDVWALGMTLYAAVEGSSPFRRTSVWSTLTAIVTEPLPEPRLAGPLTPVLRELMDKDPEGRPTAAEARQLLEAVAAGAAPELRPSPPQAPPVPRTPQASQVPRTPTAPDVAAAQRLVGAGPGEGGAPGPGRGRTRALVAAAVAGVVLVGGGVTYALLGGEGDRTTAGRSPEPTGSGSPASGGGDREATGEAGTGSPRASGAASPPASRAPSGAEGGAGGASESGAPDGKGGGDDGKGETGKATGAASPTSSPGAAPACSDIGGGKYNCVVWRDATSYTHGGEPVGTLKQGVNYFYCQENLNRPERYGKWTNVWWAKTDDDNGNKDVYVSDVYVKGGDNDQPLPGLPVC
ncbi:serine/threonine-protein kinase [Streptomyces sp. NEAU-S77]|uniref:serine/threonine-protein kinase n=1 Tax=Streptomyces sp. NEAU-S77 TaxID=3411033 RepID=UPI003B9E4A63